MYLSTETQAKSSESSEFCSRRRRAEKDSVWLNRAIVYMHEKLGILSFILVRRISNLMV